MVRNDLYLAAPDKVINNYMVPYNPGKPKLKSILWQNLDWLEEIDKNTQVEG